MKTAILGITRYGTELALQIAHHLPDPGLTADVYLKEEWLKEEWLAGRSEQALSLSLYPITESLGSLIGRLFPVYNAFVFIMACGIVVRTIAPYLRHKTIDPAVVVTDEKGQYVISLLAGHIGGANKLAQTVARITGGIPVITTATDVRQVPAFDQLAVENDCHIENPADIKCMNAALVNGGSVALYTDLTIKGKLPANLVPYHRAGAHERVVAFTNSTDPAVMGNSVLWLRPRNLILGIGCRKGITSGQLQTAVKEFMQKNNKSLLSVRAVASIDLKQAEAGLLDFCRENGLPLHTVSREIIAGIEHQFTCSRFVKEQVGVGSVAEACAVASGNRARLICPKTVYTGITLALAEEEKDITL